jgi:hypothetical protein
MPHPPSRLAVLGLAVALLATTAAATTDTAVRALAQAPP